MQQAAAHERRVAAAEAAKRAAQAAATQAMMQGLSMQVGLPEVDLHSGHNFAAAEGSQLAFQPRDTSIQQHWSGQQYSVMVQLAPSFATVTVSQVAWAFNRST